MMKHIPIFIFFLVAVVGHNGVQANSAQGKNKLNNPQVARFPHKEDGAEGHIEHKSVQRGKGPRKTVSLPDKQDKKSVGNQVHYRRDKPNDLHKKTKEKQNQESVGSLKRKSHPAEQMKRKLSAAGPMDGIISFLCNILKTFNLRNLPFIKDLCDTSNASLSTSRPTTQGKPATIATSSAIVTGSSSVTGTTIGATSNQSPTTKPSSTAGSTANGVTSSTMTQSSPSSSSPATSQAPQPNSTPSTSSPTAQPTITSTTVQATNPATTVSSTSTIQTSTATTQTTTTTVMTTTRDPSIKDFMYNDGTSGGLLVCIPYGIKVISAFYGKASCPPQNITANFTLLNDATILRARVSQPKMGNVCPGASNQLTGQYYCDTTVTYPNTTFKVALGHDEPAGGGCGAGTVFRSISLRYVQPGCTVNATVDVANMIGQNFLSFTTDFRSSVGTEDPIGCKSQFSNMFAMLDYTCG